jgi:hypothetical protein
MPHSVYSTVLKIKKNAPKARCENQPFVSTFTVVNRHELNSTKSNILHSRLNDKHLLSSPSKCIKIDLYVTAGDDENGMSVQSGGSNELPSLETSPTTVPSAVQVALLVPYNAHQRQDEVLDLLMEIEQHDLVMLFHQEPHPVIKNEFMRVNVHRVEQIDFDSKKKKPDQDPICEDDLIQSLNAVSHALETCKSPTGLLQCTAAACTANNDTKATYDYAKYFLKCIQCSLQDAIKEFHNKNYGAILFVLGKCANKEQTLAMRGVCQPGNAYGEQCYAMEASSKPVMFW